MRCIIIQLRHLHHDSILANNLKKANAYHYWYIPLLFVCIYTIFMNDRLINEHTAYLDSQFARCIITQYVCLHHISSMDPVKIAERVLELAEEDNHEGILNLVSTSKADAITKNSPVSLLRKNYLKLSLIIHPDKLQKKFSQATKAFQCLVQALESLTATEVIPDEDDEPKGRKGTAATSKKPLKIGRSNEGCYRTRVCCPRCKQPWNEGTLDGNPDYCYNFLMMGLKQYTCSTCLCEFGCITALHKCPTCKHPFEYSPSDYHKKIHCSNKKCTATFGFMMYNVSERVMNDMRKSIKEEMEKKLKAKEAKMRRAARSNRGLSMKEKEASFFFGLSDVCPRCGEDFTEMEDEEEQRLHLLQCNDEKKHDLHKEKQKIQESKQKAKEEKRAAQESVQVEAAWQFLGANDSQLWLLDEGQIKKQAKLLNIDSSGDKDDVIERIVQHKASSGSSSSDKNTSGKRKLITHDGSVSSTISPSGVITIIDDDDSRALVSSGAKKKRVVDVDSLPTNFYSMDFAQLRSLCAAHNLRSRIPKDATKSDLIELLENEWFP